MESFTELVSQGAGRAWFFMPSAVLLGALHGLEPGHSKTLMAAFIVAIRGTVRQAVLLGLAATVSHTLIVWVVALGGLYLWQGSDAAASEPYLQLASGIIVLLLAAWMLWRTYRAQPRRQRRHHDHHHSPHHHHDQPHGQCHAHAPGHDHHHGHHHHHQSGDSHARGQEHEHVHYRGDAIAHAVELDSGDAHERAHAAALARQLANRRVTTWQIVLFGLTGGLIPCPAAITVLLLCLQLQEPILGVALVLCFSIGLAVTLMSVGALAAIGTRKASARWAGLTDLFRRAPYLSSLLLVLVGCYMAAVGIVGLAGR